MPGSPLPVKHLLVDLDGTLLGNKNLALSYDFVRKSLSALKVYGGISKAARFALAVGTELRRTSTELTNDRRLVDIFAKQMNISPEQGRGILRDGVLSIFPTLEKHFYPIQGAKEFLDWACERYPMTLATNPVWPPEIIELRVKWAGIDPSIFRSITHVRRMHAYKPSPEYYREILEQEGLKPEHCLLIGDNVKMDLPATRVGIPVFIVGPYKKMVPVRYPKAKAAAWKGPYPALKDLLEGLEKPRRR